MSVPVKCSTCGFNFNSQMFSINNAFNVTITNCAEQCPRCGNLANVKDGTYDFVGSVLTAIRAPGVMRADIVAFRELALAVQRGKVRKDEAAAQVAAMHEGFATLWKWLNENGGALSFLIAILAIYIAILSKESSDAGSVQAHHDAQQQIQLQQKIYDVLNQEKLQVKQLDPVSSATNARIKSRVPQPIYHNRHERRKSASIKRRNKLTN